MFVAGLEGLLEASPVLHAHWTGLFYHMVPGDYELERMWIKTNIMTPALSWNAAKSAFIGHFQRGDFMDGQRYLYNDCHQTQHESIQQYSRRFQILATQLGYADNDLQSIYRYICGLQQINTNYIHTKCNNVLLARIQHGISHPSRARFKQLLPLVLI